MGSLIGSCVGGTVAGLCCGACGACGGKDQDKFGKISRIPYLFLTIISGLFAVFMAIYGEDAIFGYQFCDSACVGNGSVYRVSFCLFIFEAIHVLFVPFVNDFHWMWFPIKFLLYVVGIVCAFALSTSTDVFNDYADYFARYASIFYLLIQIIILIDWAWNINEWSQIKAEKHLEALNLDEEDRINAKCTQNPWELSRAIISISMFIISLVLIGFFYDWYGGSNCATHETLISITLLIVVLNAVGSGVAGGGAFPIGAIMSVYATFLLFSAMQSATGTTCNHWYDGSTLSMWIGIAFTILAICYAAMKADLLGGAVDMTGVSCFGLCPGSVVDDGENERSGLLTNSKQSIYDENAGLGDSNYDDAATDAEKAKEKEVKDLETGKSINGDKEEKKEDVDKKKTGDGDDGDVDPEEAKMTIKQKKQNTVYFHLILMLAACYMAMLFTDWGTSTGGISLQGDISGWINMACQWLSILLFWQSLFVYYKAQRASIEE